MEWLKKFMGGGEEQAPIAAGTSVAPAPVTDTAATVASGKKVKLNFKKIPKQVVAEIAAQTTGQPLAQDNKPPARGGKSLSGKFNAAASMFGADDDDLGSGNNMASMPVPKPVMMKPPAPAP